MRKLTDIIKVDHELLPPGFKREATLRKASEVDVLEEQSMPRILVKGGKAYRKRERDSKAAVNAGVERSQRRKKQQSKYYAMNKARLNLERARRNKQPEYIYAKAKQRAEEKGLEWDFTLDTWMQKWIDAPRIRSEESGFHVTAWSLRGPIYNRDAQLVRIDTSRGWTEYNTHVIYKGEEVVDEEQRFT